MQFYDPNITNNVSYEQGRIRFIVPFSNTNYIVSVVGEITFAYGNFTCYTLENVGRTKDSFVRQMRYQGTGQLRYGWENTFHFAVEGF